MIKKIGFIGVGHIAHYMLTGFARTKNSFEFILADPDPDNLSRVSKQFAPQFKCAVTRDNQRAVDKSELIILAVRPDHMEAALAGLTFRPDQLVASVVAGASLKHLESFVSPAKVIRVLPISCVAINKSPILVFPKNQPIQTLFSLLGQVHVLPDEKTFTPGTALVGAFYAWIFALMDETAGWTADQGIDPTVARQLVIQTIEGACAMASHQKEKSLTQIWDTLATPGGISEYGAKILKERGCLKAWPDTLEAVTQKMEDC
jgi:pyrroline-5-carboxylate reductase